MSDIVLIIQARMGSSRLPNKMMRKLSSLSLIEWVVKRVKKTKKLKKIIIATTKNKKDYTFKKIESINFSESSDTVGPKSISKQELIKEFRKIL